MNFSEKVRTARESRGYSMKKLGEQVGVSASEIHRIEHGGNASLKTALKLQKLLNISLDESISEKNVKHYDSVIIKDSEASEPKSYYFPWINDDKYITIEMQGDSMMKTLPPGTIVGCLQKPSTAINDGDVYFIILKDGNKLIRRLSYVPGSTNSRVSLISENDIIGSFEVDYDDIEAYHRVNKVIKIYNR